MLAAFPAEAGIMPGFQPLEGRAEQELARTTLANLLAEAEAAGNEALIADVQCLSLRLGEKDAVGYLMQCARASEALAALGAAGSRSKPGCAKSMGLPEGSVDDYLADLCGDDRFDCDLLRAIAEANRGWGTKTGAEHADQRRRLAGAAAGRARRRARPNSRWSCSPATASCARSTPGQRKAIRITTRTPSVWPPLIGELLPSRTAPRSPPTWPRGLRAGQAFAAAYTRAKRSAGVADFDDLIRWTRGLLASRGWANGCATSSTGAPITSWSTNRRTPTATNGRSSRRSPSEFFSGSSEAERRVRTLFMVGDFKQAIFGFQGTDPNEFERAREWVREHSAALREAEDEADDGSGSRSSSATCRSTPASARRRRSSTWSMR